jgi:hypothetical protein
VIVAYGTVKAAVRRGAVRHGAAALVALTACACAQGEKPKPVEENVAPADYRAQVADLMRRRLAGRNAKDASIAEPVLKTSLATPRYVACVRLSATEGGTSKGSKFYFYAAYFFAGKITQVVDATVEQCDKATFLPFPELQ